MTTETQPLFNNEQIPNQSTQTDTPADINNGSDTDNLLSSIVNPDGKQKFNSVDKALESIPHAQQEIDRLKLELAKAQESASDISNLEELFKSSQVATEVEPDPATPASDEDQQISETKVLELVSKALTEKDAKASLQSNRQKVITSITEGYGDQAGKIFSNKAQELGMTVEALTRLSEEYPDMVIQHFKTGSTEVPRTVTQSTKNTQMFNHKPAGKLEPVKMGATNKELVESYRQHAINQEK